MAQIDRTEEFKAWVAKQDPAAEYEWDSPSRCALAQFGIKAVHGDNCEEKGIPYAVYFTTALSGEPTFGALAERLANTPARSGDK